MTQKAKPKSAIKPLFIKFFKLFWKNSSLFLLALLLFVFLIASLTFWFYYFNRPKPSQPLPSSVRINQPLLKQFLETYQRREVLFENVPNKEHFNLFRGLLPETIESSGLEG